MVIKELTAKELLFKDSYLLSMRPHEAAIKAGYAESTATSKAFTWVSERKCPDNKRHLFNAIQSAKNQRAERTKIDADWVLLKAKESFEINAAIKYNDDGDKEMINAAAAGKFLDQVGKHVDIQAFKEKVEVEGSVDLVSPLVAARKRVEAGAA